MEKHNSYLKWHFIYIWSSLVLIWKNAMLFALFFFCVPQHLKTLFYPWKRQKYNSSSPMPLYQLPSVIAFNLTSSVIGFSMRLIIITYGVLLCILFFILFAIPLVLWPLLFGISLPFFLLHKKNDREMIQQMIAKRKSMKDIIIHILNRPIGKFICSHNGISQQEILQYIRQQQSDAQSAEEIIPTDSPSIGLKTLASSYLPLKTFLSNHKVSIDDFYETALWYEKLSQQKETHILLDTNRIKSLPGIGIDWAYGYTPQFDRYAKNLIEQSSPFPYLIGRDEEILKMQQILLKSGQNNILILGEPGTARHIMVKTLAHQLLQGNCLPPLAHKRILNLDMHALSSSQPLPSQIKGVASEVIAEAEVAGNVIIFIDEFDKYISSDSGGVDFSDVFAKASDGSLRFIGITTPSLYHAYIEKNTVLNSLFEKIKVEPPSAQILLQELQLSIVPNLEKKYSVVIGNTAIKKVIEDANRFVTTTPFPAKAIELLEQVILYCISEKKKVFLTANDVDEYFTVKMKIPVGEITAVEKEKLVNLEDLLHRRIINQHAAIQAIASSLRRSRIKISSPNQPLGTFLFLGPTGVGKTETAKALAEIYFGASSSLHRFDMGQYQLDEGLERLIGSIRMKTAGELTSTLTDHPYGVYLFDEIEKSDTLVTNLFLPLIDEGYITDALGRKVDAKNTILIATSNAGAEFIREKINQAVDYSRIQTDVLEYIQRERIFTPEFLNRFDGVIVYTPLSEGQLREVTRLMLDGLNRRLEQQKLSIIITDELVHKLASLGFDKQFGARNIRRTIETTIEDQIAQKILAGEAKEGTSIQLNV